MSGVRWRDPHSPIATAGLLILAMLGLWFLAQALTARFSPGFARADRLVFGLAVASGASLAVMFALRWARRSWRWIGLNGSPRGALLGVAVYAVAAGLAGSVAAVAGGGTVAAAAPAGEIAASLAYLALLVLISEAWPEELVMRGFLLSSLDERWKLIISLPLQAVVFTLFAALLRPVGAADAGFLITFGFALAAARAATGSLWAPISLHLALMTTQQILAGSWNVLLWNGTEEARHLAFVIVPLSLVIVLAFDRLRWGEVRALHPRFREKRL